MRRAYDHPLLSYNPQKSIFHPITLLDNDITDLSSKTRRITIAIINRELNAITDNWRYILNVTTQGTLTAQIYYIYFILL